MKKVLLFFVLLLPTLIWAQQINVSPTSLTDFSYFVGHGPSNEDAFVVSASGLIGFFSSSPDSLMIRVEQNFEIAAVSGGEFAHSITLYADENGDVAEDTIYVRMVDSLSVGTYEENIQLSAKTVATAVHCSGVVMLPTLPAPSFTPEGNTYSGEQEVYITCDVEGALIKYRTSQSGIWQDFTPPFLVDRDMIIWAKATKEGYNDSEEVSAEYAIEYTITATADPEHGIVTVSGNGIYHYDDIATLTATPNDGYLFSSWSNGETDNPMEVTVTGNATYQAIFEAISYQITVAADPENGGVVSGGGTYHFPDMPTVIAVAHEDYVFVNWTEDGLVVSEEPEYTFFTLTSHVLVAHFQLVSLPTIAGGIIAPEPICAGNMLQLDMPEVNLADTEGWQIAPDSTFTVFSPYTEQVLDETYNGWQLRYMASNEAGTTFSEQLTITVYPTIDEVDVESIVAKNCGTSNIRMLVYPRSGYQYQWYKDGQAIIGATGQYYYPEEGMRNGTYYVELGMDRDESGDLLCPMASPNVEVVVTNVFSQGKAYPNPCPTIETLYIIREKKGDAQLRLYSVDGKLIHSQTITQGQNTIGVNLPQGIYVSYIIDGQGETQMERIIIQ